MKGAQEEAVAKAASRVRHEKPYDYKKKAHEEQATFNEKVLKTPLRKLATHWRRWRSPPQSRELRPRFEKVRPCYPNGRSL